MRKGLGVYFHKRQGRYQVCVQILRTDIHVGYFDTEKEAKARAKEVYQRRDQMMGKIANLVSYIKYGESAPTGEGETK